MVKVMYFDAPNGVSGDMFVGALIDLGADFDKIKKDIDSLGLPVEVRVEKASSHGIGGTRFTVIDTSTGHHAEDSGHHHDHRHLSDIREIINNSSLDKAVKESVLFIFEMIAQAEGEVHGADMDSVHFHEVGALDSIGDIVAAASAYHQFDIDVSYSSPVNVGSGTIECQHGLLPVPAPAVLKLMEGIEAFSDGIKTELATPTGVALLKYFSDSFRPMPKMKITGSGTGMGSREIGRPNIFRVICGEVMES